MPHNTIFGRSKQHSAAIMSIMQDDKPGQIEHFKLSRERIQRFFSADTPAQTIEETIVEALELWHSKQLRKPRLVQSGRGFSNVVITKIFSAGNMYPFLREECTHFYEKNVSVLVSILGAESFLFCV